MPLTPKALETLEVLVERAGEPVRRRELIDAVWPDRFVEDAVLTQNIYTLRRVLDDDGERSTPMIETLRGRGYRFNLPVRTRREPAAPRLLAVLPFEPLGLDEDGEVLGLAMADALITRLSRIGSLVVRPTHAVRGFSQPASDPFEAARRLRVDAIVIGTLRRASSRLRIGAQLLREGIDAPLWAGQVETTEDDLFAAEDALFRDLISALDLERSPPKARDARPPNAEAHRAYLRGRYFWNKRDGKDLEQAIRSFEEAIAIDPGYAPAHAGLADTYVLLPFYSGADPRIAFPRAREAASRALEIDERLAAAHTALAYTRFFYDWSWQRAEKGFRRALEIDPSYATARHWRGFSWLALRRFSEGIGELEHAIDLDPLSLVVNADLGLGHYFSRQLDDAIRQFRATLELDPSFAYASFGLALSLEAAGEPEAALAAAIDADRHGRGNQAMKAVLGHVAARVGEDERARRIARELAEEPATQAGHLALLYAALGPPERALKWLGRAAEERSRYVLFLGVWPAFDSLRDEPAFEKVLESVGVPTP